MFASIRLQKSFSSIARSHVAGFALFLGPTNQIRPVTAQRLGQASGPEKIKHTSMIYMAIYSSTRLSSSLDQLTSHEGDTMRFANQRFMWVA